VELSWGYWSVCEVRRNVKNDDHNSTWKQKRILIGPKMGPTHALNCILMIFLVQRELACANNIQTIAYIILITAADGRYVNRVSTMRWNDLPAVSFLCGSRCVRTMRMIVSCQSSSVIKFWIFSFLIHSRQERYILKITSYIGSTINHHDSLEISGDSREHSSHYSR